MRKILIVKLVLGMVLVINIFAVIFYIYPRLKISVLSRNINRIVSEVYPGDPMYDSVLWVEDNTPEGSRIFVLGDTYFYLASGRMPSNYRSALGVEPIVFYPLSKFEKEIQDRNPDYWIIDERMFLTYSNWNRTEVSDMIKSFLICRKELARFDYWAIYSGVANNSSCVNDN